MYATELANRMTATFEHLKIAQREARRNQRDFYNAQQHGTTLHENDFILLYKPSRQVGLAMKLLTHWSGPFRVVCRVHDELYILEDQTTHARQTAHIEHLARYYPYADSLSTDPPKHVKPPHDSEMTPSIECEVGDCLIFIDSDDNLTWHLVQAIETTRDSDEVTNHLFRTYNKTAPIHCRSYKPAYVDPKDGKQAFINRPMPRYQAVSATISKNRILRCKIQMTKSGHIMKAVCKNLSDN